MLDAMQNPNKYQFLIGNVYPVWQNVHFQCKRRCQFLIGNVYLEDLKRYYANAGFSSRDCQFLIGNVYQLVLSVSNYDTTPFSSQNQSKMFKKSVDL